MSALSKLLSVLHEMPVLATLLAGAVLLVVWVVIRLSLKARRYPPGPAQTWIGGNMRDLPKEQSWRTYEKWSKVYGPIIHLRLFNKHLIVLNTVEAITDLLDKRASIYSYRPTTVMLGELVDRKRVPVWVSPDDPRFPVYRRMMNHTLSPKSLKEYAAMLEQKAAQFLKNLLDEPEELDAHIRRTITAIIMHISYGYTVPPSAQSDPFVDAAQEGMQLAALLIKPGRWLVDMIPVLRYLPDWFPGAGFKRQAKVYRKKLDDVHRLPVEWTKAQMAAGTDLPSLTSHQLASDDRPAGYDWEDIISNVAGNLYTGGSDTTLSAVVSFFYNMMLHPSVQHRAQEEMDRVVGHDRLPNMGDREALPYLDCVIAEVVRWCPPGPLAMPHKAAQEDEYAGYLIPAGSTVLANVWAIMHDERTYPDPYTFDPARFMGEEGQKGQEDPRRWVWGFGRRTCPGQHLAESTLFIIFASVLAVFEISMPVDAELPELEFTTGLTTRVKPFGCRIVPRPEAGGVLGVLGGGR